MAILALLCLAGMVVYGLTAWLLPRDPVLGKWFLASDPGNMNYTAFRPDGTVVKEDGTTGTWRPMEAWYASSPPQKNGWISHEFFAQAPPGKAERCRRAYIVEIDKLTMIVAVSRDGRCLANGYGDKWGRQGSISSWLKLCMHSMKRGYRLPPRGQVGWDYFSNPPEEVF